LNYLTIIYSIEETKQETIITKEETDFLMNHYKTYLESNLAKMFFAHENNLLGPDEYVVRLINKKEETIETEASQMT
jgi:hypothetical protein